jgi:hypothetical protein
MNTNLNVEMLSFSLAIATYTANGVDIKTAINYVGNMNLLMTIAFINSTRHVN